MQPAKEVDSFARFLEAIGMVAYQHKLRSDMGAITALLEAQAPYLVVSISFYCLPEYRKISA
jgi:hypothetical protein